MQPTEALCIDQLELKNRRVFIRVDFNVPLNEQRIPLDMTRIDAALPTIRFAMQAGAKVRIVSHIGRPPVGILLDKKYSLDFLVPILEQKLQAQVHFLSDQQSLADISDDMALVLLENIRCHAGEVNRDEAFIRHWLRQCDVWVMDAFATAHRTSVSTYDMIQRAPQACMGFLMKHEIQTIESFLTSEQRPKVAVLGGAKISSKIHLIEKMLQCCDWVLLGGALANTLWMAQGYEIGQSLVEKEYQAMAVSLLKNNRCVMPVDAMGFTQQGEPVDQSSVWIKSPHAIGPYDVIQDIGPVTQKQYNEHLMKAQTILWNGPMGRFEDPRFQSGTMAIAHACGQSQARSLAGGGETLAALHQAKASVTHASTGGGACLDFLWLRDQLPGIQAFLMRRSSSIE